MSQRINPIGPNDRGAMPVQRVERRKRTPEEHQPDDGHEVFDEELEREMRERGTHRAKAPTPEPPPASRSGEAGPRDGDPAPPDDRDDRPHIDISV